MHWILQNQQECDLQRQDSFTESAELLVGLPLLQGAVKQSTVNNVCGERLTPL
jgi:hypothetical protein